MSNELPDEQPDDEAGRPLLEMEHVHNAEEESSPEPESSVPPAPQQQQVSVEDRPVSLAFSHSTPWLARVLLPLLMLATHALFYYGQTADMWKLRVFAHIDAWANATDFTARRAFDTVGLSYEIPFRYDEDKDVQTFTYYYAIDHLWKAKGLPGKTLPRLAAILLVVFSGVWPHLKLLWLNGTWFFGRHQQRRTNTLHWLSCLGKWSLADVLVVCVMVGVLHLDWIVEPADIKQGLVTDLPQLIEILHSQYTSNELCDKLLKMKCATQKRITNKIKCKACETLVHEAYTNPEWARSTGATILKGVDTSGGGLATMRVVGMWGIYIFCGAVIMSILLSLIVDIFDHRAKQEIKIQEQRAIGQRRLQRVLMRQQQEQSSEEGEDSLRTPLLENDSSPSPLELDFGHDDDAPPSTRTSIFSLSFLVLTVVTTAVIFLAVDIDTMERQVHGAGPMLLHDILGVNWERPYSLRSLMWTTGSAGEWDYLLMGTFALFIVLGPAIRAALLLVASMLDRCCCVPVAPIATLVNFIGAFCAWEVFAIAIVMVQMLMPSITNTIVNDPVCASISDDGSCLQVEFNVSAVEFSTVVIGGFLLLLASTVAVRKATDRGITPVPSEARVVSRVMPANHDYQRIGERTSEHNNDNAVVVVDNQQELVFETNQV